MTAAVNPSATLLRIVSRSANTEIGKRWNFAAIQSVDDFRRNVPLTDYEVYRPYIQRMVDNGEKDLVAVCGDVVYYAPTSGTTSKSKLIPKYANFKGDEMDHATQVGKTVMFANMLKSEWAPHGVPIIPVTANFLRALFSAEPNTYPAPSKAYYIADLSDALYVQMVFALKVAPNTSVIASIFISTLISAFNVLANEWPKIVADIRKGTLKSSLKLDAEERESLEQAMNGPNAVRADELQLIFESASVTKFKEIVPQIWPCVDLVSVLCSGEFSHYIPRLQYFLGDAISLFSFSYASSEGLLGVNKWPYKCVSAYALLPQSIFYEFIPLSQAERPNPDVLLIDEVKVGEYYEIVMTTGEGFYRYRVGDIVTVVEISPEGPVVDVIGRKKMCINLIGCKLYGFQVSDAVGAFIEHFKKQSTDYDYLISSDTSVVPSRYVIWLECDSGDSHFSASDATAVIEAHLKSSNVDYKETVESGHIGPLAVELVKPGTIAEVKRILKQRSAVGEMQMKLPRVVWDMELLKLLKDSTIN